MTRFTSRSDLTPSELDCDGMCDAVRGIDLKRLYVSVSIFNFRDVSTTDLHIYILDAIPPVHVVWNHVDTDELTTQMGGTFTSSSASLSNQSR